MQFFPSDEIINSIIKTGATTFALPAGSKLRVGGLSYEIKTTLHLDLGYAGVGGLDDDVLQANQRYTVFAVLSDEQLIKLVASLNAEKPAGYSAFRRIGQINSGEAMELSVVSSEFVSEIQQSQLSTIELGLSVLENKVTALTSANDEQQNKINFLEETSSILSEGLTHTQQEFEIANELLDEVKNKLQTASEELDFNSELVSNHSSKIQDIESGIASLAVSAAERQSEYQSLLNILNFHKKDIENLQIKFNSVLGHRHDGEDSPLLNILDLDSEGGDPGDFLTINAQGELEWTDISFDKSISSTYEMPLNWTENAPSTPVKVLKTVANVAAFSCFELGIGGNGQKLFTSFKVPSNYKKGTQLRLSFLSYHEGTDSSKSYQFSCNAYLVKKGASPGYLSLFNLDATNKIFASQNMKMREQIIPITSLDGKISSHEISSGDLIHLCVEKLNTGETEDLQKTIVLTSGLSVLLTSN